MNRKAIFVAAILGGTLAAGSAHAGEKIDNSVWIDQTQRIASATLSSVRNSPGKNEYIGCTSGTKKFFCYARTEENVTASCYITSPSAAQLAVAASVNGDSYVWFIWDNNGVCTDLYVTNASSFSPK